VVAEGTVVIKIFEMTVRAGDVVVVVAARIRRLSNLILFSGVGVTVVAVGIVVSVTPISLTTDGFVVIAVGMIDCDHADTPVMTGVALSVVAVGITVSVTPISFETVGVVVVAVGVIISANSIPLTTA
jgi:hypothetical protein